MKRLWQILAQDIRILYNPKSSFEELSGKTLENVVQNYVLTLLMASAFAAAASFIYWNAETIYLGTIGAEINMGNAINYAAAKSASIMLFYIFTGTIPAIAAAYIINLIQKKLKFTELLKVMMYSLTPFILFGWLLLNPITAGVWSMLLLIMGVKNYKQAAISANSIKQRY